MASEGSWKLPAEFSTRELEAPAGAWTRELEASRWIFDKGAGSSHYFPVIDFRAFLAGQVRL